MRLPGTVTVGIGAVAALLLTACEGAQPEGDKKAQQTLTGIWFLATEEPDEAPDKTVTVQSWLTLGGDGKFTERFKGLYPDGRILEAGSRGEWLVTEDLFKLRYTEIEGKNLRRHDLDTMVAVRIVSMDSGNFTYSFPLEPKRSPVVLRRVAGVGKEP